MKLESAPLWPKNISAKGIPTNLVVNMTPGGEYQVARVLAPGGPKEGEFEILFSGTERDCNSFALEQVDKGFPGLI